MKILDSNEITERSDSTVYPYIALGMFILAYVIYCVTQSSPDCVLHFGKRGLVEDCSDSKSLGYGSLAVASLLGFFFFTLGTINLLKKRRSSHPVKNKDVTEIDR